MHRSLPVPVLLLALAACTVERTPREFYTERDPAVVEQREAAGEVAARVRNFAEALGRGDADDAVDALLPMELTHVIGLDGNGGLARLGAPGVRALVAEADSVVPAVARTPDLRVEVDVEEGTAWFATHLELLPAGPPAREAVRLRATGVFERDRGDWRVVQLHLSRAVLPPPPPAARDTARADTAATDTAGGGE